MRVRRLFGARANCLAAVGTLAALMLALAHASPVLAQGGGMAAGKTLGQTGKNIKVLQDLPSDQLFFTMRFFSYSLGKSCDFCHVEGDDSKDDKKEKQTARDMITMEIAINKDNFKSRTAVTCYTCHRGANEPGPVQIPESTRMGKPAVAMTKAASQEESREGPDPNLPTVDAVFAKYIQALGGEQALRKVTSMTITGTRETAGRNDQPNVASVQGTFEEYAKAPNKGAMYGHTPKGETSGSGYDGTSGWALNTRGVVTEYSGALLARSKRLADFYEPLDMKQEYTRLQVRGIDKVGDRDAYLVTGTPEGGGPERLYFDTQTGLLLRRVSTLQNVVISAPTQTDYLDYRAVSGVKYPWTIKISDVAGESTYSVLHVQKIDFKVDDSKLVKPESKPQQGRGRGGQ